MCFKNNSLKFFLLVFIKKLVYRSQYTVCKIVSYRYLKEYALRNIWQHRTTMERAICFGFSFARF